MTDAPQSPEESRPPRTDYDSLRPGAPGNSKRQRAGQKPDKLKKIVKDDVKISERKPSLAHRVRESFTGDDTRTVGNYILFDVAIPAFKQLLSDGVSTAIERLLFGGEARSGARRGYSYTPYNRYGGSPSSGSPTSVVNTRTPVYQPDPRAVHDFRGIVMDHRGAAEEVLDALNELIQSYQVATVADFYELIGKTAAHTDENWGWTTMAGSRVDRVREGFLIVLPRTMPLNNV